MHALLPVCRSLLGVKFNANRFLPVSGSAFETRDFAADLSRTRQDGHIKCTFSLIRDLEARAARTSILYRASAPHDTE